MFVTALLFILVLGSLIFVHELGHFLMAKKAGAYVEQFSIGIGPAILKTEWLQTPVYLRLFPLGGYVSLIGEVEDEGPGSFVRLSFISQLLIILGGIVFNLISAFILLTVYLGFSKWQVKMPDIVTPVYANVKVLDSYVYVTGITENSALKGVIDTRDFEQDNLRLVAINDIAIDSIERLVQELKKYKTGEAVQLVFKDSQDKLINIKATLNEDSKLGIKIVQVKDTVWDYKNIPIVLRTLAYEYDFMHASFMFLKDAVTGFVHTHDSATLEYTVGGPISLIPVISSILSGPDVVLQLIGILGLLNLNLAIMNALCFPGLDGWHVCLVFLRLFIKDARFSKVVKYITYFGLLLLLILAIIITFKDIRLVFAMYGR